MRPTPDPRQVEEEFAHLVTSLSLLRALGYQDRQLATTLQNTLSAMLEAFQRRDLAALGDAGKWAEQYLSACGKVVPFAPYRLNKTDAQIKFLEIVKDALTRHIPAWPQELPHIDRPHESAIDDMAHAGVHTRIAHDVFIFGVGNDACASIVPPSDRSSIRQLGEIVGHRINNRRVDLAGMSRDILKVLGLPRDKADNLFKSEEVQSWLEAHKQ